MSSGHESGKSSFATALSSWPRLVSLTILLPAAVVGTNQLLLTEHIVFPLMRRAIYPWMAVSTAILGWSVGRYLQPPWLRWLIFAWSLILLDIQTIAACLSGPVAGEVGYTLVSSQIALVVLWAILGPSNWQSRLPTILLAAAAVVAFPTAFMGGAWEVHFWNVLMFVATFGVALLCFAFRWRGIRLCQNIDEDGPIEDSNQLQSTQFGLKHLFLWATAMVPLLFVAKGLDYLVFQMLYSHRVFPVLVFTIVVAIIDILAFWAVLGKARPIVAFVVLVFVTVGLAFSWQVFLHYIYPPRRIIPAGMFTLEEAFRWVNWNTWFGMSAALTSALLLFLRAQRFA